MAFERLSGLVGCGDLNIDDPRTRQSDEPLCSQRDY